MSDDIVDKLRDNEVSRVGAGFFTFPYARQAADEIERLRAEIVRLRGVVVLCPKCYEAEHGVGRWEQAVRGES